MTDLKFAAPVVFGLESAASSEYKRLGFENVAAETGRVTFTGDITTLIRANLFSSYAQRILLVLSEFEAGSFDELFDGTYAVPWEDYIPCGGAFPVDGSCVASVLSSTPACQRIVKKAVSKRLGEKYSRETLPETGTRYQIRFMIMRDRVCLCLDTTGTALHKRGYRAQANEAPLRETLAAGITDLSRYRGRGAFLDPFCGSGTITIEAAFKACRRAPGLTRGFDCCAWSFVPQKMWSDERERARAMITIPADTEITGRDIDPACVELSRHNAEKAGVGKYIRFEQADASKADYSDFRGIIVTNPPYGERMLDIRAAEKLYADFGRAIGDREGKTVYVLSSDSFFEDAFGKKATKTRKLYNGTIKCSLYMYY